MRDKSFEINEIIFTGGGRKNKFLISQFKYLNQNYKISIIDNYGFDGDLLEAQMFAYIGVRSLKNLSLSSPHTTRVKKNVTGGNVYWEFLIIWFHDLKSMFEPHNIINVFLFLSVEEFIFFNAANPATQAGSRNNFKFLKANNIE